MSESPTITLVKPEDLQRRRKTLGYSQPEFAALLQVTESTVSRWETGVHRIPEAVALLIRQLRPKRGGRPKRPR